MGYALFFESMLNSVVEARDAFAKPDALVLPNVATVRVALLSDDKRYDDAIGFWDGAYGLDFSSLAAQTRRDWSTDPPVVSVSPSAMLSDREGEQIIAVDCAKVTYDELLEPMEWGAGLSRRARLAATGWCSGSTSTFTGARQLSTPPTAEQTHWYQTVLGSKSRARCARGRVARDRGARAGKRSGEKRQLHVYANWDLEPKGDAPGRTSETRAPGSGRRSAATLAQWVVQ